MVYSWGGVGLEGRNYTDYTNKDMRKIGGHHLADNGQLFRINCPWGRTMCKYWGKEEFSHGTTPASDPVRCLPHFGRAALYWSRTSVNRAPWTRRWCWSQAAPQESVSAWLSGWHLTPTKHSKVTAANIYPPLSYIVFPRELGLNWQLFLRGFKPQWDTIKMC